MTRTRTDDGSPPWRPIEDEPSELREWATERSYALPVATSGETWSIGSSARCWLRLQDRFGFVSRTHATLERGASGWSLRDAGSKNGLWLDGQRQAGFSLVPGAEIAMGTRVCRRHCDAVRSIAACSSEMTSPPRWIGDAAGRRRSPHGTDSGDSTRNFPSSRARFAMGVYGQHEERDPSCAGRTPTARPADTRVHRARQRVLTDDHGRGPHARSRKRPVAAGRLAFKR